MRHTMIVVAAMTMACSTPEVFAQDCKAYTAASLAHVKMREQINDLHGGDDVDAQIKVNLAAFVEATRALKELKENPKCDAPHSLYMWELWENAFNNNCALFWSDFLKGEDTRLNRELCSYSSDIEFCKGFQTLAGADSGLVCGKTIE